jgi:serine phosphatase RsbU (regulator of sigma subunit)
VDADGSRLRYASAGQESCLRLGGEPRWLPGTGPVLGLFEGASYDVQEHALAPNDLVALFSDGVTDQENEAGAAFGREKLQHALAGDAGATSCLERVHAALDEHGAVRARSDDTTMALMGRSEAIRES